ncbi:hypothetical protein PG988_006226 [Apiospora saccharicola]
MEAAQKEVSTEDDVVGYPGSRSHEVVDKIVVCGSEVLRGYWQHQFTEPYIEKIKEIYRTSNKSWSQLHDLVNAKAGEEGFHWVLTELAFLDIRRSASEDGVGGIIPLTLSGGLPGDYLPFIQKCRVVLKQKEGRSADMTEQHMLYFRLLEQLYPRSEPTIKEFEDCYKDALKKLSRSAGMGSTTDIIVSRVNRTSAALFEHLDAATRVAQSVGQQHERIESEEKKRREEQKLQFLGSLSPLSCRDRKDRNPDRMENTCEWVTRHPKFQTWHNSSASSFLLVSADPGCGKSVLAKYLVDVVLSKPETRTTCYFFFKDEFDDQRSAINALRSVIHQLFTKKLTLFSDGILRRFQQDGCRGVVCVLDAFDECEEREQKILEELFTKFYMIQNTKSSLKFLVTNRPYHGITRRFHALESKWPSIRLAGEAGPEMDQIHKEIDTVIHARAEELKGNPLTEDQYDLLVKGITSTENRTYLWATLILDLVQQVAGPTPTELEAILRELPQDLNIIYENILLRSPERSRHKATNILRMVVAAERPLTPLELTQALAVEECPEPHANLQVQCEAESSRTIREYCGLFVRITESKVYLIHQTARQFLVREHATQQVHRQWEKSLSLDDCHLLLARICISSLLFEQPSFKQFAEYAATRWFVHFRKAGSMGSSQQVFLRAQQLCHAYGAEGRPELKLKRLFWLTPLVVLAEDKTHGSKHPRERYPAGVTALVVAVVFDLPDLVKFLVKKGEADILARQGTRRYNALDAACELRYAHMVRILLTSLSWAKVAELLRQRSPCEHTASLQRWSPCEHTPLGIAIRNNDEETFRALVDISVVAWGTWYTKIPLLARLFPSGWAQVNLKDQHGFTPLHIACRMGHAKLGSLLINRHAQVNARSEKGKTPLHEASRFGQEGVARLLIEQHALVDARNKVGDTPLHEASLNGHEGFAKLLIEGHALVDARNEWESTPLHRASYNGHKAVVRLLLEHGAKINPRDWLGYTPLGRAHMFGHNAVAQLLLKHGARISFDDDSHGSIPENSMNPMLPPSDRKPDTSDKTFKTSFIDSLLPVVWTHVAWWRRLLIIRGY